tara:strand:- start:1022 stop:1276 length:255 start_codon:yes stop_codon:yes gene_type:complete
MSKYVNNTDGKFNHGKWIRENSLNERLSSQSYKRMDGLHNVEDMKVILRRVGIFYRELSLDLEDEGFEKDEILEFLIAKIKNAI